MDKRIFQHGHLCVCVWWNNHCGNPVFSKGSTKLLTFLLSMHSAGKTHRSGKVGIYTCYNKTKGGVDTLDELFSFISCIRMSKRWRLTVIYGLLNATADNSSILYHSNVVNQKKKPQTRRMFLRRKFHLRWYSHRQRKMLTSRRWLQVRSGQKSYESDFFWSCHRFKIASGSAKTENNDVQDLP